MKFNLLISNPPYIPTADIPNLQAEVRDYDPMLALDGGEDGLRFFRYLAEFAPPLLATDARVMLEFGDGQAAALQKLFSAEPWEIVEIKADYSRRPRILVARFAK